MDDRMFARLKPEELDELTEDGYRRRRAGDLARAFATPRTEPARTRGRRPYFLMAGTVAAGLAAAAAVVVVGGGDPAPRKAPAASAAPTPDKTPDRTVDARTFLLAAASTAKREPATSGRYWYVNERSLQKVHNVPSEYMRGIKALDAELKEKEKELAGDPEALAEVRERINRELGELKTVELPYLAYATETRETWRTMRAGGTSRLVSDQDVEVTFDSPQDEADWKAAGSPELADKKPQTMDDSFERILSIDNPSLTLQNISKLPTGKDALKRRLDELWKRSPNSARANKAGYLWQTGVDLMTAPIKPGTRSALFQVLADQPGITSQGPAKDALGRTGVALSASTTDAITLRLIIDPRTAELLEYDVVEKDVPLLRVALADMGFTDELGERPRG
ncbi:hypothetical protein [Nonomuraea sp. NPDC050643]|uniref:hypothetical protein n=1 Tax=Nonomuraea sp. NPDC050643 TaxID=3155660 RepID=UPI0033FC376B